MTNYEDFMGTFGKADLIEDSARQALSDDPDAVRAGRSNLTDLINNELGPQTVIPETDLSSVVRYVTPLRENWKNTAIGTFADNPHEIIDAAKNDADHPDKFKENYLLVEPIKINGNDEHNRIVAVHKPLFSLQETLMNYQRGKQMTRDNANFIIGSSSLFGELIKQILLTNPHAHKASVNELVGLAVESYQTSSTERALFRSSALIGETKGRIDSMLPEDQRADYTERTLKAYVDSENAAKIKTAAEGLYKVMSR